jgi:hypothetical protein
MGGYQKLSPDGGTDDTKWWEEDKKRDQAVRELSITRQQRDEYKAMLERAIEWLSHTCLKVMVDNSGCKIYPNGCVDCVLILDMESVWGRPPLIKAELGCSTCRNNTTVDYCADCKLRDGDNGSKWQPLKHEGATHE